MVVLGLASLGQTFVILLGGIDLSVGSLVSAATVFLANFLDWRPDLVWLAVPARSGGGRRDRRAQRVSDGSCCAFIR